jgi:hypothetical protein
VNNKFIVLLRFIRFLNCLENPISNKKKKNLKSKNIKQIKIVSEIKKILEIKTEPNSKRPNGLIRDRVVY